MMMMAYSEQTHHSHPDSRHPPQHQYTPSLSGPQWVPAPRDRLSRSSSFYAAANNQSYTSPSLSSQSSPHFFDMAAGTSSPSATHVTPLRSALPMARTLSHDGSNWSSTADDWSGRGVPASGSIPATSLNRMPPQQPYDSQYSFTHDSGSVAAWDGGDRKARHVESTWASASAQATEFPLEERQWPAYASDASGQDSPASPHYPSVPHVRGAPAFSAGAAASTYGLTSAPLSTLSSGRPRKGYLHDIPPPLSPWQDATTGAGESSATVAYGASPSPVLSAAASNEPGSPPAPRGHAGSPPVPPHHPHPAPVPVHVKQEPDTGAADAPAKKKRRRASGRQLDVLNSVYARTAFPSTEERHELARQLEMTPRSVQIWFQNRRQTQRERRPMGASPYAPNVDRIPRRERNSDGHSVRNARPLLSSQDASSDLIPLSVVASSSALPGPSADAVLAGSVPIIESQQLTDDTQLSVRTRGRAKRVHQ